jgi:hypothetical protein
MCSIDGIILTQQPPSFERKTCPSAIWSTTNPTQNGMASTPLIYVIFKNSVSTLQKTMHFYYKDKLVNTLQENNRYCPNNTKHINTMCGASEC